MVNRFSPCCPCSGGCNIVTEDFSGDLSGWSVIDGTWSIDTGRLKNTAAGTILHTISAAEGWMTLTLQRTLGTFRVIVLADDAGHGIEIELSNYSPDCAQLRILDNGTPLTEDAIGVQSGWKTVGFGGIGATVIGTAYLTITWNAGRIMAAVDVDYSGVHGRLETMAVAVTGSGSRWGFYVSGEATTRVDDIVLDYVEPTPATRCHTVAPCELVPLEAADPDKVFLDVGGYDNTHIPQVPSGDPDPANDPSCKYELNAETGNWGDIGTTIGFTAVKRSLRNTGIKVSEWDRQQGYNMTLPGEQGTAAWMIALDDGQHLARFSMTSESYGSPFGFGSAPLPTLTIELLRGTTVLQTREFYGANYVRGPGETGRASNSYASLVGDLFVAGASTEVDPEFGSSVVELRAMTTDTHNGPDCWVQTINASTPTNTFGYPEYLVQRCYQLAECLSCGYYDVEGPLDYECSSLDVTLPTFTYHDDVYGSDFTTVGGTYRLWNRSGTSWEYFDGYEFITAQIEVVSGTTVRLVVRWHISNRHFVNTGPLDPTTWSYLQFVSNSWDAGLAGTTCNDLASVAIAWDEDASKTGTASIVT